MYNKPNNDSVVRTLNRSAYPLLSTEPYGSLRDLYPLDRMIGNAPVVGMGEGTHGTHEFFTLKHRFFKYLVEEKGFTTFMLELNWGTGLQLNDYVLYGKGNPVEIMQQEFLRNYRLFATEEYLELIEWMRQYNKKYPQCRQLQFMGNDVYFPHIRIFDDIFNYVQERGHSELVPKLRDLYDGLIPTTDFSTWQRSYDARPERERQQVQRQAEEALRLVKRLRRGADPEEADWAEQQATVVVWIARTHATEEYWIPRDQAMAENTIWWYRHKNSKTLISAHNAHIGHNPEDYKTQGTWLQQILGPGYVNLGLFFYQGSFIAIDENTGDLTKFTVGPPPPENAEKVLGRVQFPNYMLDMRTVNNPARAWLNQDHQVRNILAVATEATVEDEIIEIPLRLTYDILIMIHDTTASHPIAPF
ncbi:erythromycin esterase family protein [Bacillus sp. DNRA2]|uniref:erythromycin esterase family protein n=1 Tax=Bacillus sp. DNRA2 TaxID=2723053 RepID=UPI00145D8E65|nr:erythromycin esterase family protein [Bacillus sp. DNRA2]NMD69795.1 erythromycin esterase family protein [Bacillus sp. DNRA2]